MKLNKIAKGIQKLSSENPDFEVEDLWISDGRQYIRFEGKNNKGRRKEIGFDWENEWDEEEDDDE